MKAFISSVYEEDVAEGGRRRLAIRRRLKDLGLPPAVELWMAEYSEPGLEKRGWRAIVDTCVHALHESDLMIVLLYRRWGSAIEVDRLGPAPVSYLEIELFHASLRRVPVLFFQADDFDPEPELAALVALLRRITSPAQWFRGSQREIEAEVVELVRWMARENRLPAGISGFCDALSDQVSFARVEREISSTRLSFLDRFVPASGRTISLDRIDLLLSETDRLTGTGEGSYVDRLSRLWMALRDLASESPTHLDRALAERWVKLCEMWASSAAWLHLHGPLQLGVLATLHTRVDLRRAGYIEERSFPFGPFASEAYSVAKASDTRRWKARRFEAARRLATRQIEAGPGDPSGAYGIRASATLQLALMGRPWLAPAGLRDYRRMYETRSLAGASNSQIGEALAELGYAEFALGRFLPWKRHSALQRLREGVALLDRDHPERRPGFVIRAKRKFADALERSGRLDEAGQQRLQMVELAERHGLPRE